MARNCADFDCAIFSENMTKRATIMLLLLLFSFCGISQTALNIDSLEKRLEKESGSEKIETLIRLINACQKTSSSQSIEYGKQALRLAQGAENTEAKARILLNIARVMELDEVNNEVFPYFQRAINVALKSGNNEIIMNSYYEISVFYQKQSKYNLALDNANKALNYARIIKNREHIAKCIVSIAIIYSHQGKLDESIALYLEALELFESLENIAETANCLNKIGTIYEQNKEFALALEYYQKALGIFRDAKMRELQASGLYNIGEVYRQSEMLDTALNYFLQAQVIYEENENFLGTGHVKLGIGNIREKQNRLGEALRYYLDSQRDALRQTDKNFLVIISVKIGRLQKKRGKFQNAEYHLALAEKEGKKLGQTKSLVDIYLLISELNEKNGNNAMSLGYYKKFARLRDSITNAESNIKIHDIIEKYANDKKQAKINELEKSSYILNLEIDKSRFFVNTFILIFIFLIIIAFFTFRRYRNRTRMNRNLKKVNEELGIANQKYKISEQKLREINNTKDRFFTIIAHDLRSPFNTLLGFSETLTENIDILTKEEIREYNSYIFQAAKSLFYLLENLLNWANAQTGKLKYNPKHADLANVINQNIDILRLNASQKNIELISTIVPGTFAYFDEDMIFAIIRNLSFNAIKFTSPNGKIVIAAKRNNDMLQITVSDNGIGIREEMQAKLFNMSENFSTTGTSEEKGTGLGLIICREFAEKHGGKIWVESTPEIGSNFHFTLPRNYPKT